MEELIAVMLGFLVFFVILIIIVYVLNGIVYTKLAKKVGMKNWGWAWVPYGIWYITATIGKLPKYIWIVPIALGLVGGMVDELSIVMIIAILAYQIYNDKKILERFGDNGNLAFLHLIPLVGSIIVYVMIAMLAFGDKMPVTAEEEVQAV